MTSRVAVIGLGLIGGSMAAALRGAGRHVRGYDLSTRNAEIAHGAGLVDELCGSAGEAVAGADAVIVAVPVLRSLKLLMKLDLAAEPDALILDTGSAKRVVVEAMSVLSGAERMVGGHPLAGSEHSGPAAADARLFGGKSFFLTPTPFSSESARKRALDLVEAVGGNPVWADPAEHDRILALTSHLPQILASLLSGMAGEPGLYAGPTFREMTRVAASDSVIWRDILLANAEEVVRAGRDYAHALSAALDSIEREDVASIEEMLIEGGQARRLLGAGA